MAGPHRTRAQLHQELDQIRHLLSLGYTDTEIIRDRGMKRRWFYVCKAKIYEQDKDLLQYKKIQDLATDVFLLRERLTRLYKITEDKLTQQQQTNHDDAIGASKLLERAESIAINIFKLETEGVIVANKSGITSADFSRSEQALKENRLLPSTMVSSGTTTATGTTNNNRES